MKTRRLLIPIMTTLFLASCTGGRGGRGGTSESCTSNIGTSEGGTSNPGTSESTSRGTSFASSSQSSATSQVSSLATSELPSYQSVPVFTNLPSYPSYSGTPGVAENHLTGISINPSNQTYAFVGDSLTIKGSLSPSQSGVPESERFITYSIDKEELGTLSQDTALNATVTCLAKGDLTVLAESFESRYTRTLVIHILPNDGSVDMYQPDTSTTTRTEKEKAKFGWDKSSDETKKGDAEGDAELGLHTWHFVRSNPAEIGTYGGGFKFGASSPKNEGSMTFSTTFDAPIKTVVIQMSSTGTTDPETGRNLPYGSSTFDAWFNQDEPLTRTVSGTTYTGDEECYTSRYSTSEYYSFHIIDCEEKSGSFTFKIGESVGAIYLKSILVEYA